MLHAATRGQQSAACPALAEPGREGPWVGSGFREGAVRKRGLEGPTGTGEEAGSEKCSWKRPEKQGDELLPVTPSTHGSV